jgi:Mrp family chromosome partitioning ATPase
MDSVQQQSLTMTEARVITRASPPLAPSFPKSLKILATATSSNAMKGFFVQLRQRYEYVTVDLSPIAPAVDVRSATHLVDAFVFIIEWGKTKIDVAEQSLGSHFE